MCSEKQYNCVQKNIPKFCLLTELEFISWKKNKKHVKQANTSSPNESELSVQLKFRKKNFREEENWINKGKGKS